MSNDILKTSQMKYNSYLKSHKNVTMSGNKRYEDKSGEYYLKNSSKYHKSNLINKKFLTKQNTINQNIIKVNKKKIFNQLVPIPKIKEKNKLKNDYEKKNLNNAVNNAKYIRRYQYSKNLTNKKIMEYKEMQVKEGILLSKIKYIQIWWKTIFLIIKIQKFIRGALYRSKLYKIIKKQEKCFESILNLEKRIKKIFWKKWFLKIIIKIRPGIKYFFSKWRNMIFKRIILDSIITLKKINNEKISKIDYNSDFDNNKIISKSYSEITDEKEKTNINKKLKNINNSLISSYKNIFVSKNSSLPLINMKNNNEKNLALGLETSSSSKIIYKNNSNYRLNEVTFIHKNNKTNKIEFSVSQYNTNQIKTNNYHNPINLKYKSNYHKNTDILKNQKTYKDDLTNFENKANTKKNYTFNKNDFKQKNKFNIKSYNKNKQPKEKKKRVYENKLYLYINKCQTIETSNNNYIPLNKDLQEYSESNLNESQFNMLLDNSTFKDNPNVTIYNIENNKNFNIFHNNNKENEEKKLTLKEYFIKWTKIYIRNKLIKKLLNKNKINKGIIILKEYYAKNIYKLVLKKLKIIYIYKVREELKYLFDCFIKKKYIKSLLSLRGKCFLHKYFNKYKLKIYNKAILEKLKKYQKDKIKNNQIKIESNKETQSYNYLKEEFIKNFLNDNDFLQKKLNLNDKQTNNCFIINNLNYNNNTNNIDIKLGYDNTNRNINEMILELPKKYNKQRKKQISLYKKNYSPLFKNENNEFIVINQNNINSITHSHLFPRSKPKGDNYDLIGDNNYDINNKNLLPNEVNLNKSLVISKYSNKLNWDLMTKKNQIIMVINIIERHRQLIKINILNKFFKAWKNELMIQNKYITSSKNEIQNTKGINDNIFFDKEKMKYNNYEKIDFPKKNTNTEISIGFNKDQLDNNLYIKNMRFNSLYSDFSKDEKKYYTNSLPDLSNIKMEKINKCSIYKKKAITGSYNFVKKNNPKLEKNIIFTNNENDDIYNKNEGFKYGYMTQSNYYGLQRKNKIEEMEISFVNLKENKNNSNPILKRPEINYDSIKYIKPFITDDNKEIKDKFNNINEFNDIILEDIEENNDCDINKENLIINLKSYFKDLKEQNNYNTINQIKGQNNSNLNEDFELRKSKSEKILF